MKMRLLSCLAVVLLVLVTCGTAWAQQVSGTQISGTVKDSSGGVLPGVEVTVKKTDTGMIRTVFTGSDGSYTIPNLPVGPYELKAVLQGFKTYEKTGIILQVNTNPTIDVTMGVGTLDETITVTADAMTVETKSTGVGQVINNQTVVEMPLNGRQATELIFLSGLSTPAPAGDLNTNKNYPTVTISVAGGQANGMTYIMDGGTHNDPFNNLNLPTLFPDALQEFKVESSALPGAVRAPRGVRREHRHEVRHEQHQGQRVRVPARLPLQRPERLRHVARQPEAQPVRRHDRRARSRRTRSSSSAPTRGRSRRAPRRRRSATRRRRPCWPATSRRSRRRRATPAARSR